MQMNGGKTVGDKIMDKESPIKHLNRTQKYGGDSNMFDVSEIDRLKRMPKLGLTEEELKSGTEVDRILTEIIAELEGEKKRVPDHINFKGACMDVLDRAISIVKAKMEAK